MATGASDRAQALEPEAFKAVYPDLYFRRFVDNGIRPDGRPFGAARPVTIGLDAVGTADASALVKLGSTTVLAGVKLEVLVPTEAEVREGQLVVNVELTPLCSNTTRPGRPSDVAVCCTEQVRQLLKSSNAVDLSKLAILSGNTAWVAYLDIYVLDSDGCLLDACLLGAISALASLKTLPSMAVADNGQVRKASDHNGDVVMLEGGGDASGLVRKNRIPISLTCGLFNDKLIVDPTAEEEKLMDTLLTVALDASTRLIGAVGLHMPGGAAEAGNLQLQSCIAAARLRCKEVLDLLEAAVDRTSRDG